jgi:hypothetical protein
MSDMTGTRLEGTEEIGAYELHWESKQRTREALAVLAPPLGTGMQVRTHHGGVGNKTPEQWKWWGIKANWDRN